MNPLAFLNPSRWLLLAALVGALVLGYYHWRNEQREIGRQEQKAVDQAATDKIKAEAKATLAAETAKVSDLQAKLESAKAKQEIDDVKNRKTITDLGSKLAGRLFDPNARGCGNGGGGTQAPDTATADNRANDGAQAGGLLSDSASELFRRITREADEVNIAYISCRADGVALRALLQ